MSMSTHIYGIKPPDEKWKKMKAIWNACLNAGIDVPDEVDDFFGEEEPNELGVVVSKEQLGDAVLPIIPGYAEKGFIIDISKLPKDIQYIKIENSW